MVLNSIDKTEVEVEIEKGLAKARYELMNRKGEDEDNMSGHQEEFSKTLNYANLRATNIPTVQRLYPPKPASIKQEIVMEGIKEKLLSRGLKVEIHAEI